MAGEDDDILTCIVCLEILGNHGGPASLPCGHNGCLGCLQRVQTMMKQPSCPSCRAGFDPKMELRPNLELKEIILQLMSKGGGRVRHVQPEVTFGSVMSGMLTIIGRTLFRSGAHQHDIRREPRRVEEEDLWGSVLLPNPSAPPVNESTADDLRAYRAVMEAEPPHWLPDSSSSGCMRCKVPFRPVTCGRHHCRFCGGLFCYACSRGRSLLPEKFRERTPQRVCDACYDRLLPVQKTLTERVSNASQRATHDVTDYTCMRSWINSPLGRTMEDEIYKATNALRSYTQVGQLKPERAIPEVVLRNAKGVAILTVAKVGCGVTYTGGTGLVVARLDNGLWSAPSAIGCGGMGWGPQIGGKLSDFILVLRTKEAVGAFSGRAHVAIGAELSAAAGPVGRTAEADVRAGDGGKAACYSYSLSKGVYVGVSLEGMIVARRGDTNANFYGDTYITSGDILSGACPPPRAAGPLYEALHALFS